MRRPSAEAIRYLGVAQSHIQSPLVHIYSDDIFIRQGGDRTSLDRLGHDMPDEEAARCAREATVGYQRDTFTEARTLRSTGHQLHFAHPWFPLGAFVTYDQDVVRFDAVFLDRRERFLLALKYAGLIPCACVSSLRRASSRIRQGRDCRGEWRCRPRIRQKGVAVNALRHHSCQRCSVRRLTVMAPLSRSSLRSVMPCHIMEATTMIAAQ
jgi:hypothetical protein